MALSSLSWDARSYPWPLGPGAPFKLTPGLNPCLTCVAGIPVSGSFTCRSWLDLWTSPGPDPLLALAGIVDGHGYPVPLGCCGAAPTAEGTAWLLAPSPLWSISSLAAAPYLCCSSASTTSQHFSSEAAWAWGLDPHHGGLMTVLDPRFFKVVLYKTS